MTSLNYLDWDLIGCETLSYLVNPIYHQFFSSVGWKWLQDWTRVMEVRMECHDTSTVWCTACCKASAYTKNSVNLSHLYWESFFLYFSCFSHGWGLEDLVSCLFSFVLMKIRNWCSQMGSVKEQTRDVHTWTHTCFDPVFEAVTHQ